MKKSVGLNDTFHAHAPILDFLYLHKTSSEITHIALANKIGHIGIQTFYDNLIQGKTEVEVACAVETAVQSQTGRDAIKFAKAWAYIMSGINSSYGGRYSRNSGKGFESVNPFLKYIYLIPKFIWGRG